MTDETQGAPPTGRYHGAGWVLDLDASETNPVTRLVSIHEAWHDRLQFTTMHGLLVQVLWAIDQVAPGTTRAADGDRVLLASIRAHEEFASWMTERLAGPLLPQLRLSYPTYARHADRATQRIGNHPTEYGALHATSAVYRACMQGSGVAGALQDTLDHAIGAASIRTARPDRRLAVLTSALRTDGWGDLPTSDASLTLADYGAQHDHAWDEVARAYYDRCARLLRTAGYPTLDHDAQRDHIDALIGLALQEAERPIRLVPASANTAEAETGEDVVLRAMESESIRVRASLPHIWLPATTPIPDLTAGHGDDQHLFLAIRPATRLVRNHGAGFVQGLPTEPHVAVLRGSRSERGQRTVALLDVSHRQPDELFATGLPVLTNISMRSLAEEPVRQQWAAALTPDASTVLVDLSPTLHLRMWAEHGGQRTRYAAVRYRAADREVHAVVWQLSTPGGGRSRVHLAVVSPTYPAALAVWLTAQPTLAAMIVRDDGLADEHEVLVGLTMGHLLAEEAVFDFQAGDHR